jgi:DNA-binding transcriptional LysR family regulator
MRFPKVVKVRQDFPRPRVEDVGEALREQCAKGEIRSRIEPGAEVAITAGSRGIAGIDGILRSLVEVLKEYVPDFGRAIYAIIPEGHQAYAKQHAVISFLRQRLQNYLSIFDLNSIEPNADREPV